MSNSSRAVRAFVAEVVRPPDPEEDKKQEKQPTVAAEHKKAVAVGAKLYRQQLPPWGVFLAALLGGIIVHNGQYGLGTVLFVPVLAIVSYLVTDFLLTRKSQNAGRTERGQQTGRRIRRINTRAWRSGKVGFAVGVWLVAVAATTPPAFPYGLGDLPGVVVWWGGVAVWAGASWDGWWQPAEEAGPHELMGEEPADSVEEPVGPVTVDQAPTATPPPAPVRQRPAYPPREQELPLPMVLRRTVPAGSQVLVADKREEVQRVLDDQGALGKVVGVVIGPSTIQYNIEPNERVKTAKILNLKNDFGLALKTGTFRFLAPVEGHSFVGIEAPRAEEDREDVPLGEVLASRAARDNDGTLLLALGKDTQGGHVVVDLARLPHILIAGASGAGKSECVNSLLCSILNRATPRQVRLLLIDLKRVELAAYKDVPHLVTEVVTEAEAAANALRWAVREMENRYVRIAAAGARNIDEYNKAGLGPFMSKLVILVDEFAALMITAEDGSDVEQNVVRVAQEGRASGVHLILATQRPSVDVITGLIKANIGARLAFMTTSLRDSMVILDAPGAEKLLGRGDALWRENGAARPIRLQGSLVTNPEIAATVDHWRKHGKAGFIPAVTEPVDVEPVRGPRLARDEVLDAGRRLRDHDGTVYKQQIVDATPGMNPATRNAAITDLFRSGDFQKTDSNAKYLVPDERAEKAGDPTE